MNKVIKTTLLPVTAVTLLLGGCSHSSGDKIIESKAGDVKTDDIMKEIGNDQVSKTAFQLILNKTLEDKYGDKIDKDKIDKQIKNQQDQLGGKDQFNQALKQQGLSEDKYKDQLKMQEYQKKLIKDSVKISDKEVKKDTTKVAHILIEGKKQKSKDKAEDIKKQLDDGANFADLASKKSDDPQTKNNGGSLGYIVKGEMDKTFEKTAFDLKPGETSKVIKTEYGYHIIKAQKQDDFKKQKSDLKDKLAQTKIQKDPSILTKAYKDLLDEYKVKYDDKDVKKYINDNMLNPDKLKEQAEQQQQQMSQQQMQQ